jgi:hypothetical protein
MEKTRIVVRKRVKGRVDYNDGEFADVQTVGIEGVEKDLWLETIQIYCEDTNETSDEFQRRFPVGRWLDILPSLTSLRRRQRACRRTEDSGEDGKRQDCIQ